jgi:hypothetical protein
MVFTGQHPWPSDPELHEKNITNATPHDHGRRYAYALLPAPPERSPLAESAKPGTNQNVHFFPLFY